MTTPLASRLRQSRLDADLTQQELASRIDRCLSTVASSERGRTKPDTDTLQAWALACGVSVEWILNGKAANAAKESA